MFLRTSLENILGVWTLGIREVPEIFQGEDGYTKYVL